MITIPNGVTTDGTDYLNLRMAREIPPAPES
jgi:hypothetical protein